MAFLIFEMQVVSVFGSLKTPVILVLNTRLTRAHISTPLRRKLYRSKMESTFSKSMLKAFNWPISFSHWITDKSSWVISSGVYGNSRSVAALLWWYPPAIAYWIIVMLEVLFDGVILLLLDKISTGVNKGETALPRLFGLVADELPPPSEEWQATLFGCYTWSIY